jgi:hypothetical protein
VLDMRATVDREEFFAFRHRKGRLKLIERLAAAYRAGDLLTYRTVRPTARVSPRPVPRSPDLLRAMNRRL